MKLTLEIDLTAGAVADDPVKEAGRVLRYWGGALQHLDLAAEQEHALTDSASGEVGVLRVVP